jgi:hypothetical protein
MNVYRRGLAFFYLVMAQLDKRGHDRIQLHLR